MLLRPRRFAETLSFPFEGKVASGFPRKPDDGRGENRSVFVSVETECRLVLHLFRRLRRHLPLTGEGYGDVRLPFRGGLMSGRPTQELTTGAAAVRLLRSGR